MCYPGWTGRASSHDDVCTCGSGRKYMHITRVDRCMTIVCFCLTQTFNNTHPSASSKKLSFQKLLCEVHNCPRTLLLNQTLVFMHCHCWILNTLIDNHADTLIDYSQCFYGSHPLNMQRDVKSPRPWLWLVNVYHWWTLTLLKQEAEPTWELVSEHDTL